jgi:hypothetical protein
MERPPEHEREADVPDRAGRRHQAHEALILALAEVARDGRELYARYYF